MLVHHPDKKGEDQQDEGDNHFKCIKIGQSVGVADTSAHTHMHTRTYLHSLLCTPVFSIEYVISCFRQNCG